MKTEKSNKLRGTVLFTVVAVMALLIIFLTGTLALAQASSNRAHKSYSSSQASYTAKTAITGFTEAMSRDENIAKTVVSLGVGTNPSKIYPEVRINNGGSVDKSVGLIGYWDNTGTWQDNQIIVEKVGGTNEYAFNETDGKWEKVDMVKVTATARVAKEEATVTAYIKKRPEEKNTESPSLPTGIKGFNTIGDGNFANGGRFTGGLGVGLKRSVKQTYTLHNAVEIDTTLSFINGDVVGGTANFAIDVHEAGSRPVSETIIKGNFWVQNGQNKPLVELNYKMHKDYRQQQIPYLYVDGVLGFSSQCTLVAPVDDDHKYPYNIFVGTLVANKNQYYTKSADIYMMDEYTGADNKYEDVAIDCDWKGNVQNTVDVVKGDNYYGNGDSEVLYEWTNSVINKTQNQNKSYGSSMYCNGQLHLNNVKKIEGDVRVKKDCYIDGEVNISGDLVVGGTLHVGGKVSANRIFCNNVENYGGGTASAGETFKTVNNDLHIPDELAGYADKLEDLEAYLVKFPRRNFFVWDPAEHKDAEDHMMLLNGNTADDAYVLYYYWDDKYAPGMKVYMDETTGEYKYVYADEAFDETGYKAIGKVDEYIDGLLASKSFLRDEVTTNIIKTFLKTDKPLYSSELPRVDDEVRTWYNVMPQYVGDDTSGAPIFRETSVKTDYEKGYYIAEGNTEHKFITELPYYTVRTYDDKATDIRTTDRQTIYSDSEPHRVVDQSYVDRQGSIKEEPAVQGNVYKYDAYGQPAYPVSMERDAIYADKTKTTKIVRTLTEVREDMNLENLDKAYPNDVPAAYKSDAEGNIEYDGSDASKRNTSITKSCTIQNDVDSVTITIDPKGKTIWVILNSVTMKNNADIIVDLDSDGDGIEAGKVCFLIRGTLYLSNNNAIVNKSIKTGGPYHCVDPVTNQPLASDTFNYTKDWGMEFYGQQQDVDNGIPASILRLGNGSTVSGAFRCPYTDFACTKNGKYAVKYIDEYNNDWSVKSSGQSRGEDLTSGKPPVIGNALFRDVLTDDGYGNPINMNEFGMYYTACGQGGSSIGGSNNSTKVTTSEGIFDLIYFSGV